MDPFVVVVYQGERHKSKVDSKAGKKPVWNHTFPAFKITHSALNSEESRVKLAVFDEEVTKDDLVGDASYPVKTLVSAAGARKWFPIFCDKKLAGEILLEIQYQ